MVVAETLPKDPVEDNDILICPLPVMFVNSNSPLRILLEVASLNVSRAANEELSAVILVENEELLLNISAAKLALATAKAPLMFEAICAEPDRAPLNIPVNCEPLKCVPCNVSENLPVPFTSFEIQHLSWC